MQREKTAETGPSATYKRLRAHGSWLVRLGIARRERRRRHNALVAAIEDRIAELERTIAVFLRGRGTFEARIAKLKGDPTKQAELKKAKELHKEMLSRIERRLSELATLEGSLDRRRAATFRALQLLSGGVGGALLTILSRRILTGHW